MKTKEQRLLELAQTMFDVAAGVQKFLILGLETRADRNLDEIRVAKGHYEFPGFRHNFSSRINTLLTAIQSTRETARQLRYTDEIRIKELAVMSGIGRWGRNSLVIHEKFGTRLRFVALETSLNFGRMKQPQGAIFPLCRNCDKCLTACPTRVIGDNFSVIRPGECLAYLDFPNVSPMKRCDICQSICPAND